MEQSVYERNSMTSMISVMPNQVPEDARWTPGGEPRNGGRGPFPGEVGGCLAFCFMGFSRCCPFLMSFEVCGYMILIYKLVGVVNTHVENQQMWWLISKKHIFLKKTGGIWVATRGLQNDMKWSGFQLQSHVLIWGQVQERLRLRASTACVNWFGIRWTWIQLWPEFYQL